MKTPNQSPPYQAIAFNFIFSKGGSQDRQVSSERFNFYFIEI